MMLESNVFMQLLGRLFSAGVDCSRVGTRIAAGDTVEVACVRAWRGGIYTPMYLHYNLL